MNGAGFIRMNPRILEIVNTGNIIRTSTSSPTVSLVSRHRGHRKRSKDTRRVFSRARDRADIYRVMNMFRQLAL